jgi:hypothetical protein
MRRALLSAGAFGLVAASSVAVAQQPTLFGSGTPVGTPMLRSVGAQAPQVAPPVGQKVGTNPTAPKAQQAPPGFNFDLKNVVAPVDPASLPPALRPQQNQSLFDTAFRKWAEAFGLTKPPEQKVTFTPGMSRRNRERDRQWWRD